jgi:PAS domain S-box-containing protein
MITVDKKLRNDGQNQAPRTIQTNLDLLQLIMNNIPQAVFWKDRNLFYLGCNQAFAEDAGFSSPEEIIGKTDFDMPWRDQVELYRADDQRVLDKGEPKLNYEEPQTTPDGSTIWLSTSKIPVYENGQIVAVLGMYEDITARKQVEQTLQESEARYSAVVNQANDGVTIIQDNMCRFANKVLADMLGYTPEEVIDTPFINYVAPESKALVAGRVKARLAGEDVPPVYDAKLLRKDGTSFDAELSSGVIQYHGKSADVGLIRDITERKQAEDLLRSMVENAPEAIGIVDLTTGLFTDPNENAVKLYGLPPEKLVKVGPADMSPAIQPDGRNSVEKAMEKINAAMRGETQVFEWMHRNARGEDIPCEIRLARLPGNLPRVRFSATDISERKRSQQALEESEERYSAVVNQASDGVIIIQDNICQFVNQFLADMLGYSPEEMQGMPFINYVAPESRPLLASRVKARLEGEDVPSVYEAGILRKDGTVIDAELSAGVIQYRGRSADVGLIRDVTERRRAQQALQESEARYSAVVTQAKDGVAINQDNLLVFVNQALADMLGYTTAEIENTPIDKYIALASRATVANRIKMRLAGEKIPPVYEVSLKRKDGAVIDTEFSDGLIDYRGKPAGVSLIRDITERKKADEALRESEERFRRFTEATVEGLVFHDQGKVVDVNPAAVALFGFSDAASLIGRNLLEFIAPEYHEMVLEQMKLQSVLPYEIQGIYKDGSTFSVETSTRAYKVGERTIRASSVRDIRERKRLEQQIQTAFERRGHQVQLSTQVSQSIAAATNLEELYQRVVTQVKEQFGYYHTQLLRYYADQNAVVLVTGYGEIGAKMLVGGHRMPMGEGLIGTAASTGDTVLRPVLENDPDWHPNPLLPDTKGEIAVPIKLGDTILGVLDVQSDVAGSLGSDDRLLLEGLGGQIATAIESTRLRQEMSDRLEEINRLYRAMSHEGWQTYRETADFPMGYMYDQTGTRPVGSSGLTEELIAKIPLTVLGGEVIGTLAVADDPQRPFSPEDRSFLQQISEQVTLSLESARLFEQTQSALSEVARRASELDTVARLSATTSTVLDPDTLLQTVVDLTKERFGIYHVHIYLADTAWKTLLLSAGAGEVGRKMVADGLSIAIDAEKSLVARAARERQAVIVNDVRSDPDFLSNRSLPDTRSEMAVPMIVGDKVLGVFDVQSDKLSGFTKEDSNIYTTLAAQVAVALQNARLYVEQAATVTQLRELDRLKSAFLANMSHELRTPLNSILGFSDVILEEIDGPLTEPMHNDLQLIQKNGQHLLHLINDVLDMAKIEAGRINLSPERFMIHEILDDVLSITSTLASEKNLPLFVESDSDNDVEIFADRTRLRQVMINLINNSIKFTDKGRIAIRAARKGVENILISVMDTGVGIPPDQLEAIFQEFAQIDTSSTRKAGGTGLGLPISRRLIELHGGRLWAESSGVPGEGSVFYVELPIEARITETIEKMEK